MRNHLEKQVKDNYLHSNLSSSYKQKAHDSTGKNDYESKSGLEVRETSGKYASTKVQSSKQNSVSMAKMSKDNAAKKEKDANASLSMKNITGPQFIADSSQLDFQKMRQLVNSHNDVNLRSK